MSKKRILPLIVFFLLVAGIDQLLGWVISDWAKKHKYDQRMELLLRGDIRSEMVILGSSRALNNYSPHTITQITGKSCYNLGFSGSNIEFHETILDLLMMQEEKPKVILLNLDDCATLYPVNGIEYRKDVLLPWINHPFVNQKVCEQLNKAEWATRISGTYRHNVNFIKALKYLIYGKENMDYKTSNIDSTGANLLVQRTEDPVPEFLKDKKLEKAEQVDTAYVGALQRIEQKCAANGIRLVCFLPPLFTTPTADFVDLIRKYLPKSVVVFDHTRLFDEATLFFNPDHLNKDGAVRYSAQVGRDLIQILP